MLTTFRLVLFLLHFDGTLFLKMWIVGIAQIFKGITIIEEGDNEPDKESERYYNGHDKVTNFMFQVHEIGNNIKCFWKKAFLLMLWE